MKSTESTVRGRSLFLACRLSAEVGQKPCTADGSHIDVYKDVFESNKIDDVGSMGEYLRWHNMIRRTSRLKQERTSAREDWWKVGRDASANAKVTSGQVIKLDKKNHHVRLEETMHRVLKV